MRANVWCCVKVADSQGKTYKGAEWTQYLLAFTTAWGRRRHKWLLLLLLFCCVERNSIQ